MINGYLPPDPVHQTSRPGDHASIPALPAHPAEAYQNIQKAPTAPDNRRQRPGENPLRSNSAAPPSGWHDIHCVLQVHRGCLPYAMRRWPNVPAHGNRCPAEAWWTEFGKSPKIPHRHLDLVWWPPVGGNQKMGSHPRCSFCNTRKNLKSQTPLLLLFRCPPFSH